MDNSGTLLLWIVYVLFRAVTSKPFFCDLELSRGEPEAHESENPKEKTNCLGADVLDSSDLDLLVLLITPSD